MYSKDVYEYECDPSLPSYTGGRDILVQAVTCWGGSDPIKLFRTFFSFTHILQEPRKRCIFDDMYQFVIRLDNEKAIDASPYRYLYYKDRSDGKWKQFLSDKEYSMTPEEEILMKYEEGTPCIICQGENFSFAVVQDKLPDKSGDMPAWLTLHKGPTSILVPTFIGYGKCFFVNHPRNTRATLEYVLSVVSINKKNVHLLSSEDKIGASVGRTTIMNYVYNFFKKNFVLSFCDDDDVHCPLTLIGESTTPSTPNTFKEIIAPSRHFMSSKDVSTSYINIHELVQLECIPVCGIILGTGYIDISFHMRGSCGMWRYLIPWKMFNKTTITLSGKNNRGEDHRFLVENYLKMIPYPFVKYWYPYYGNNSNDTPDKEFETYLVYRQLLRRTNVYLKTGKKVGGEDVYNTLKNDELDTKITNKVEYKGKTYTYTSYAYNLLRA